MRIRVENFTCNMSLDDGGRVKVEWLPWRPKYLDRAERAQYAASRATFLKNLGRRDELSCAQAFSANAVGHRA